jgi:hypothetical protein
MVSRCSQRDVTHCSPLEVSPTFQRNISAPSSGSKKQSFPLHCGFSLGSTFDPVIRHVKPCSLVHLSAVRNTLLPQTSALNVVAASFFETLGMMFQVTECHIPEGSEHYLRPRSEKKFSVCYFKRRSVNCHCKRE